MTALVALARVFADHFEQRDNAFNQAGEARRARYLCGVQAVLDSIRNGIAGAGGLTAAELLSHLAIATEAGTAETVEHGSVHEGAGRNGIAQDTPGDPHATE